jgi:predicted nucleic acid-binding protein
MKKKLYLDTTIPSAVFDLSKPTRQKITQNWFKNFADNYELYISDITINEIEKTTNTIKRENIENLLFKNNVSILQLNEKAEKLAEEYIKKGAFPENARDDAKHIAIAVVNEIESIASWDFSHIVSINPIRKIHEINRKNNLGNIIIGTLELFGAENSDYSY